MSAFWCEKESEMRADDRMEAKLDYALAMTFPASDPFTVYIPKVDGDDGGAPAARDATE
jgi:hypothetical protein